MTLKNSNGDISASTLGYQYAIQTTQQIRPQVIQQKFYEIPIADYVPVVIGQGALMEGIITNLQYDAAGDFESGVIDTADPSNLAQVNTGIAPIFAKIVTWAKGYTYSTPEVEKALASNNWDVISAKMAALKRNWDLGIQKIGFLGMKADQAGVPGLLSNSNVNVNTTIITQSISSYNPTQFSSFIAGLLSAYFTNSNSTVLPDTLVMPMSDYLGLAVPISPTYPTGGSMLEYMLRAFKEMTQNPNFQINGVAYANQANNAGYWAVGGTNRYALYRRNAETVRMDLPVDFILNAPGTANNFNWEGVGAGQFTGAIVYRPAEFMYFDWAA
jgi:hypothetical protein